MGNKEFKEEIIQRFLRFDKARASIKSLMLQNIEGKRTYLQTLLLIIFVAAAFAISIENDIGTTSLVIGVSAYLICATFICIYLPYLLTKDGDSLEKQFNFIKSEEADLYEAIEKGKIKSELDLERFHLNGMTLAVFFIFLFSMERIQQTSSFFPIMKWRRKWQKKRFLRLVMASGIASTSKFGRTKFTLAPKTMK